MQTTEVFPEPRLPYPKLISSADTEVVWKSEYSYDALKLDPFVPLTKEPICSTLQLQKYNCLLLSAALWNHLGLCWFWVIYYHLHHLPFSLNILHWFFSFGKRTPDLPLKESAERLSGLCNLLFFTCFRGRITVHTCIFPARLLVAIYLEFQGSETKFSCTLKCYYMKVKVMTISCRSRVNGRWVYKRSRKQHKSKRKLMSIEGGLRLDLHFLYVSSDHLKTETIIHLITLCVAI